MRLPCELGGVNLTNSDLSSVDLTNANLTGANLSGTNFMYGKLRGVKITKCNLNAANFLEAEWRTTDLSDVNLTGAIDFYSGLLENVLVCNTTMPDGNIVGGPIYGEA